MHLYIHANNLYIIEKLSMKTYENSSDTHKSILLCF